MKKEERICAYIDTEVYAQFKQYCAVHRKSMSMAVLDLIVERLTKEKYLEMKK